MLLYMYSIQIQRNLHPHFFFLNWHSFALVKVGRLNFNFSLNTTLSGKNKNGDNLRFVGLSENIRGQKIALYPVLCRREK